MGKLDSKGLKKIIINKLNIKLTFPFQLPMSKQGWPIERQIPNNYFEWNNLRFFVNDNSDRVFDYWIVYESIGSNSVRTKCLRENTIFITGEPYANKVYPKTYTDQFGAILTSQEEIEHPHKTLSSEGQPWFIDKNFDFLNSLDSIPKSETLCMILSTKCETIPNYSRLKFAIELKKHFKERLHWYGKGVKDFKDKWSVLSKYKYSIVFESAVSPKYITEKINDCFLAYTYPFYFGSPEIQSYYSAKSYTSIFPDQLDIVINNIESRIGSESHYEDSIPDIAKSRADYLTKYQLFALIESFISNRKPVDSSNEIVDGIILKNIELSKRRKIQKRLISHISKLLIMPTIRKLNNLVL